jgi:poly(A) polymerase
LRCESGELDPAIGHWWTAFIEGDAAAREALLAEGGKERTPRKRRRRGGRGRKPAEGAAPGASADQADQADDGRDGGSTNAAATHDAHED